MQGGHGAQVLEHRPTERRTSSSERATSRALAARPRPRDLERDREHLLGDAVVQLARDAAPLAILHVQDLPRELVEPLLGLFQLFDLPSCANTSRVAPPRPKRVMRSWNQRGRCAP